MSDPALLALVFTCFVLGVASAGGALVLARLRDDALARAFLLFYAPLTLLVLAALLLSYVETDPDTAPGTLAALEYLEAIVGFYGVMLGLPLFVHRVFGVAGRGRDGTAIVIVLGAAALQHVTEYGLGGAWDTRGDVFEDVLFGAVVLYSLGVGLRHRDDDAVYAPLGRALLGLLLFGLPVLGHDLLFVDGPGLRLYPLWYAAVGATVVLTLLRRRSVAEGPVPPAWDLSPREEEVVDLLRRGMSNRAIARELSISENTVKTHLRAIYDKSGFRRRVALIATLAGSGLGSGSGRSGRPDG